MTHKQRNFLLGCVAVFVVYFVGGAILETMHRAAYLHHLQAIRAAQMQKAREQADAKAKAKAEAKAAAPAPDKAAIPAPAAKADSSPLTTVSNLSGAWNGRGALTGRWSCARRRRERVTTPGIPLFRA
jgi:Tfp pilus assembly protein FimV